MEHDQQNARALAEIHAAFLTLGTLIFHGVGRKLLQRKARVFEVKIACIKPTRQSILDPSRYLIAHPGMRDLVFREVLNLANPRNVIIFALVACWLAHTLVRRKENSVRGDHANEDSHLMRVREDLRRFRTVLLCYAAM